VVAPYDGRPSGFQGEGDGYPAPFGIFTG